MKRVFLSGLLALSLSSQVFAVTLSSTLGNGASGLVDGAIYNDLLADIQPVQAGQPAPFDAGYGNELFGPSFSGSWTNDLGVGPIIDPITSGTIEIGIYQHDSASPGSQLAAFGFDGFDLTSNLDGLFEASGGSVNEYNVYSVVLPALSLAELNDGLAIFSLTLQGPGGEQCDIFNPTNCSFPANNGAHLIYATLTVDTTPVPVPAAVWLFGSALGLFGWLGRKKS